MYFSPTASSDGALARAVAWASQDDCRSVSVSRELKIEERYLEHFSLKLGQYCFVEDGLALPTHHWINKFDTIIAWWIVASSYHHSNDLAIHPPRAQGCHQSHAEYNRVKKGPAFEV